LKILRQLLDILDKRIAATKMTRWAAHISGNRNSRVSIASTWSAVVSRHCGAAI
jgi:hypothetical protein